MLMLSCFLRKLYEQSGFQLALSVIEMEDGVKSLRYVYSI
jgi:hypothetical protein